MKYFCIKTYPELRRKKQKKKVLLASYLCSLALTELSWFLSSLIVYKQKRVNTTPSLIGQFVSFKILRYNASYYTLNSGKNLIWQTHATRYRHGDERFCSFSFVTENIFSFHRKSLESNCCFTTSDMRGWINYKMHRLCTN